MGPTCSIIYENEPIEPGTMLKPPRKFGSTFLTAKQLLVSIIQGLVITIGCLGLGHYFLINHHDDKIVRTVIFITLLFSNIFLTLVNRSFRYSVFTTIKYKNNLVPLIISITLICIAAFLYIPFIRELFRFTTIDYIDLLTCAGIAFVSTFWIEIWKLVRKD
jgi:Ca2+-transporting ATPase